MLRVKLYGFLYPESWEIFSIRRITTKVSTTLLTHVRSFLHWQLALSKIKKTVAKKAHLQGDMKGNTEEVTKRNAEEIHEETHRRDRKEQMEKHSWSDRIEMINFYYDDCWYYILPWLSLVFVFFKLMKSATSPCKNSLEKLVTRSGRPT